MENAKRTVFRAQLTKTVNSINLLLESDYQVEEIYAAMAKLKLASDNLKEIDKQMESSLTDNIEEELQKQIEYAEVAVVALSKLEYRLKELEKTQEPLQNAIGSYPITNEAELQPVRNPIPTVKLQRLQLIKFDGKPKGWIPFWEQFKSAVHENCQLSDGDRFNYLRMSVVGKAAEALEGFPPSGAFYNEALSALTGQFGNTERLIEQYFDSIMKIEQVRSKTDIVNLRKNYNLITSAMRALTILEVSSVQYNVIVKTSILKSLPTDLRLAYYKQTKKDANESETGSDVTRGSLSEDNVDRQVKGLLQFVKTELESLEQTFKTDGDHSSKSTSTYNKPASFKGTASSLLTSNKISSNCFFCDKEHKTEVCNANVSLEKKKEALKANGRCYRCTKKNHSAKYCANKYLRCNKCKGRHATTLCNPDWDKKITTVTSINNASFCAANGTDSPSNMPSVSSLMTNISKGVLLQTACVFAGNGNTSMKLIRVVIDGGSQLTFIKENISRILNLPVVGQHRVSITGFGNNGPVPAKLYSKVIVTLKGQYNDEQLTMEAIEVPEICMDSLKIPSESVENYKHLQLADYVPKNSTKLLMGQEINLLIGADNYWSVVSGKKNIQLDDKLVAVDTKFGYTLHGPIPVDTTCVSVNLQTVLHAMVMPEPAVEKLWDLETVGITNETNEGKDFFKNFMKDSIQKCGNCYEVALPWKREDSIIENDNFISARVRAEKLKLKLARIGKRKEYDGAINELIKCGYAELISDSEKGVKDRIYYMPHRPVFREDKQTTKLRVVFDASSHAPRAESLNSLLEKGPNLNPDLIKVLLNFRVGQIGIIADIEKAFLQISLNKRDMDAHRFIWYNVKGELITYRMKRVTFGVTCSPFILSAVIQTHLENNKEKDSKVIEILKNGFYVDDLVISVDDPVFADRVKCFAIKLFKEASMNLRKWTMSGRDESESVESGNSSVLKVLGINWCNLSDTLGVDLSGVTEYVNTTNLVTKRTVLQTIARVYDPLGSINPCIIKLKVLFQDIWRRKFDWDDLLPADLASEWHECSQQLMQLMDFAVPRRVFGLDKLHESQLHIFADASPRAYGVAAYLRGKDSDGRIMARFLCSKNRVAPLKECKDNLLTLPRLELTAALLAARLQKFITSNLTINLTRVMCWTDSLITLHWIKGDSSKWKPYIANRVKEIQSLSDVQDWNHCPGRENPADLLTRGINANKLRNSEVWTKGPWWLQEDEKEWPIEDTEDRDSTAAVLEICLLNKQSDSVPDPLINIMTFSDYNRAVRVTAYVLRFVENIKSKNNRNVGNLNINEIESAETTLLKQAQGEVYYSEKYYLKKHGVVQRESTIATLNPFLDDNGLLRLGGRLQNLEESFDVKHPIILPNGSYLSKLLIRNVHGRIHHSGVNATLYELRNRFWLIKGRQLVKSVLSRCVICRRLHGKPASAPFAPLPKDRIQQAKPFEITGLDFAGPLYCKEDNGSRKCYVFLFTCAVTRAVHLELVELMNIAASVCALKRFFARRGIPRIIYSDNAKTFKRLSTELQALNNILNGKELKQFVLNYRINWKFIVERAAWHGGFYERLVRSVKDALKATVGRYLLSKDHLSTLLAEIEATINARPLTYIGSEPMDLLPLTPAHFLLGPRLSTVPFIEGRTKGDDLRKQWKQRTQMLDYFWKRWSVEYLQFLRGAHHNVSVCEFKVKEGDVVLVHGNDNRRLMWKLGLITEVIPGRDGKVRACYVKCANGNILRRPIQLLYPLEINVA